jgi:transposase-like protein
MGMTVIQIADRIPTEADAYLFLEELRWGTGEPVCPHCDNVGATYIRPLNGVSRKTRTGATSERRVWRCASCAKQFSVLTGTIFHGTKASLRTWVLVFFEMCYAKNGVSAREVERKYGVCPRTAWFMLHRIREAMKNDAFVGSMRGIIVADETWIGGDPKNRHANRPMPAPVPVRPGERSSSANTDKTIVLSLINKGTGEVRSRVIPDVTGATLGKTIAAQVNVTGSHLHTDSWVGYNQIGEQFVSHETVNHSDGEYVRGDVTSNHAEGYFSQLKRSLDGTHHHVSVEHLPRYLAEFDFRYSTRKMSDTARMSALAQRVDGKRLTYKRITN